MNEKEILQALTQVFHDVFDDDDIVLTAETTADDASNADTAGEDMAADDMGSDDMGDMDF